MADAPKKATKSQAVKVKIVTDDDSDDGPVANNADAAAVPTMSRKELLERVTADGTIKKKDARDTIDATLRVISEALLAGEDLNLPHLGKVKVNRTKDAPKATILILRARIAKVDTVISLATPLADTND